LADKVRNGLLFGPSQRERQVSSFESTFDPPEMPNFWALSDLDLALACREIAHSPVADHHADIRAEAARLLQLWREVQQIPDHLGEDRAHRQWLSSGVRKRTIQVLVHLCIDGVLTTHEY
jgi:hypothetical protein